MRSILLLLLFVAGTVHAASWDEIVEQAFDAMEDDLPGNFAYTETQRNSDGVIVGRYDPRLPEGAHWNLASIDGREPSEDEVEVEDFLERKNKSQAARSDDEADGMASIVADGSLELLNETDTHWLFGFKPEADTDEEVKFMKSVDGTLTVVKAGHYVSQITLKNRETIKPGKGVKIQKFRTTMDFAPVESGGPAVPRRMQTSIQGKAMLVIKINESETLEYSDFDTLIE